MGLSVAGLTVGLLEENCYILGCDETGLGVLIDPGDNPQAILKQVEKMGLTIEKIINTHAHFDHIMAVDPIRQATAATFHLHRADLPILRDAPERVSLWLSSHIDPIEDPDDFLEDGQIVTFGNEEVEVRFTPGHAPGHVIFVHHKARMIFGGDTLFQGSIGRFDLPLAHGPTLLQSIHSQILSLPDDYAVYPGHGPATSVGYERLHNPYVGRVAGNPQ
ncbi:MAG: MBL fold metallo-hydrolase [Caldilineaceae bacterium]|nr:MBL fold metallo-hydrolase [Caldilineaceae bacterium]HRJ44864.1 MBL fold metallo-hydrolase [Caldilineaceae bacterium]